MLIRCQPSTSLFVLLVVLPFLLYGCGTQPQQSAVEKQQNEQLAEIVIAEKNELLVSFDPSMDIEEYKKAWAIFDAKIELLGPKKNGLLSVVFSEKFDLSAVQANIAATKGVVSVQPNYRLDPLNSKNLNQLK
ncbi:MAG: hypothetical protein ACRBCI_11535 [Cellvibrionaceae bacterium]